jgi:hypothetical protein
VTLTLTFSTENFGIHCADRLVTKGTLRDPLANKTILAMGTNGGVVASYTGAAELGGRFTDEVIASAMAGEDLRPDETGRSGMRFGGRRRRDIGLMIVLACRAVEDEFTRSGLPLSYAPSIVFLGWQWKRKGNEGRGIRRFLWLLDCDAASGSWRIHPKRFRPGEGFLWALPNWLGDDGISALLASLNPIGGDRHAVEAVLIDAIKSEAARNHLIGTEVIAVTFPHPADPDELTIRFAGSPGTFGGYSPWIISDASVSAPADLSPNWQFGFGPWTTMTRGPEPEGRFRGFESTRRSVL